MEQKQVTQWTIAKGVFFGAAGFAILYHIAKLLFGMFVVVSY